MLDVTDLTKDQDHGDDALLPPSGHMMIMFRDFTVCVCVCAAGPKEELPTGEETGSQRTVQRSEGPQRGHHVRLVKGRPDRQTTPCSHHMVKGRPDRQSTPCSHHMVKGRPDRQSTPCSHHMVKGSPDRQTTPCSHHMVKGSPVGQSTPCSHHMTLGHCQASQTEERVKRSA